ncbi:MAG: hypothetical protein MRJ92_11115 [Nitrospira sp.]|nr:hypothetical protein [Nitrospira sp.]
MEGKSSDGVGSQLENADKLEELIHRVVYRDRLVHEQIKHFSVWKGPTSTDFAAYRFVWFTLLWWSQVPTYPVHFLLR